MLGQMKRQLENSRCFRQGMEKDLEECAEARWLAKPVLDSRALPLDSDNVRLQGPGVMSFEKKHTISGKGSIRLDVPTDGCRRHPSNRAFSVTTMMRLLPGENLERFTMLLLRVQLIEYHDKYMKLGEIPSYAYENFEEMYEAYHKLGGNGMITKMKEEIEELHLGRGGKKNE